MDKATKKAKDGSATKAEEASAGKTPATAASHDEKRRPERTFRLDDVSLSVWVRTYPVRGELTRFWSITIERSYKDRNGAWRYTRSFDLDSLGKIVSLCQQASEYVNSQLAES